MIVLSTYLCSKNKGADQLRLCFLHMQRAYILMMRLLFHMLGHGLFRLFKLDLSSEIVLFFQIPMKYMYEPRCEKTGLQGF